MKDNLIQNFNKKITVFQSFKKVCPQQEILLDDCNNKLASQHIALANQK